MADQKTEQDDLAVSSLSVGPVAWVSGRQCFVERVPLSKGLSTQEQLALLELSLESVCPFSLHSIWWGAFLDKKDQQALLYALHKESLGRVVGDALTNGEVALVLPSFFPLLLIPPFSPGIRFFLNAGVLTGMLWDAQSAVPAAVFSVNFEDNGSVSLEQLQRKVCKKLLASSEHSPQPFPDTLECYELLEASRSELEDVVRLLIKHRGRDAVHTVDLPLRDAWVWKADLRSGEMLEAPQKAYKWSWLLKRSLKICALLGFFFLGLEGFRLGWEAYLRKIRYEIEAKAPAVEKLENEANLLSTVEEQMERDVAPLHLLDRVSQVKPGSLYFNRVAIESAGLMTVNGKTEAVAVFNHFVQSLEGLKWVRSVTTDKLISTEAGIQFQLGIAFDGGGKAS